MRILTREIANLVGEEVELMGWISARRDHGKIIFIDIRDRGGVVQVVFTPKEKTLYEAGDRLRPEWVVKIRGKIADRPKGMENPAIPTGKLEVAATYLEVISEAATLPLAVDGDGYEIGEEIRMRYRYLDLRRPRLQRNMRIRQKVFNFCREFLSHRDFIEIETPILGRSTPEGARDYLVPSRLHAGKFYALPQSPQQYKQLLMVSGFERYFQVARCFRDEDTRGDRQPEFTQLDIEMSFVKAEEVMALAEELFTGLVQKVFPEHKFSEQPFPRITYADAMAKWKSDKPDLRKDPKDPKELAFAFIVDFPMFEWKAEDPSTSSGQGKGRWDAVHHPFTMPQVKNLEEFREQFAKDPGKMLAFQYDLVLNGYEVGGGSIRIHDPALLSAVFEAMGNKKAEVEEKFGHMLEAFSYGVPPHGGVACGMDRVLSILMGEPNIREVIALPKTGDGRDLMTGAPGEATPAQLKELKLRMEK